MLEGNSDFSDSLRSNWVIIRHKVTASQLWTFKVILGLGTVASDVPYKKRFWHASRAGCKWNWRFTAGWVWQDRSEVTRRSCGSTLLKQTWKF